MTKLLFLVFCIFILSRTYGQENIKYILCTDTIGTETDTSTIIAKGLKLNNRHVGTWVAMYSDNCIFYSVEMFANKETKSEFPMYHLVTHKYENSLVVDDPDLNIFYYIKHDSIGNIEEKRVAIDSCVSSMLFYKNGTNKYFTYYDDKVIIEKHYDENGKIANCTIKKADGLKAKNYNKKGEIISKGKLKNNLPQGIWKTYKNSKLCKIEKYKNGVLLSKTIIY